MAFSIISTLLAHLYNLLYLGVLCMIMLAVGMRIFSFFRITGLRTLEKGLFSLGLGIAIVSYAIYLIGLLGILNAWVVILLLLGVIFVFGKEFRVISHWLTKSPKVFSHFAQLVRKNLVSLWAIIPLAALTLLTYIGAAVPETEFDAIWYHLTLPKIYILDHAVHFIPGKLLYYSVLPRLTEMTFTLGLLVWNDIVAKLIHFGFGILFLLTTFALARKYFGSRVGILATLIVYATFDTLWLARTAYIDLATAFFGVLAALALMAWVNEKEETHSKQGLFILLALFAGFMLSTKHWAIAILPAVTAVIFVRDIFGNVVAHQSIQARWKNFFKDIGIFLGIAILVTLPWYIDAWIHTGNPLYPVGSFHSPEDYGAAKDGVDWLTRVWLQTFLPFTFQYVSSAFSPIFGLLLLVPFLWKKITLPAKYLAGFGAAFYFVYSFIPTHIYYRYSFGVLGVLGTLSAYIFFVAFKNSKWLRFVGSIIIAIPVLINLVMLVKWDQPVLKVFAGIESRDEYLTRTLAPNVFAFYDRGGYFAKNFPDTSKGKILTYNVHNLFYVDFPFVAFENNALDASRIHDVQDFKNQLKDQNIQYVLFKNSDIEALWNQLNHPSSFETFSGIFSKEYQVPEDSITLYKIQ